MSRMTPPLARPPSPSNPVQVSFGSLKLDEVNACLLRVGQPVALPGQGSQQVEGRQARAMPPSAQDLPIGHSSGEETPIRSSVELGAVIREQRKRPALKQLDLAGLGNTGNRFIVDLENGKPTVQLQKVLDLMDLLGLQVVVRTKASRSTSSL
jgi:y4mF family transcriptional regulator